MLSAGPISYDRLQSLTTTTDFVSFSCLSGYFVSICALFVVGVILLRRGSQCQEPSVRASDMAKRHQRKFLLICEEFCPVFTGHIEYKIILCYSLQLVPTNNFNQIAVTATIPTVNSIIITIITTMPATMISTMTMTMIIRGNDSDSDNNHGKYNNYDCFYYD